MTAAFESAAQQENFEVSPSIEFPLPFIPAWLDEYGLTGAEFRIYSHVVRRAGSDGKCSESITNIAKACRYSRNVTLKAFYALTNVYKLLKRNKRVGETDEYTLAPSSEWALPVPPQNRFLSRKNREKVDDPSLQGTGADTLSKQPPVFEEDTKVIQIKEYQEEQQQEVVVASVDFETPSIWRRNPDATRYCQIPPIYNQATGVEIQRQMESEGLTAQTVVERAIAFSKVPRLILETLSTISEKFVDGCKWLELVLLQSDPKPRVEASRIPDVKFNRLKNLGVGIPDCPTKISSELPNVAVSEVAFVDTAALTGFYSTGTQKKVVGFYSVLPNVSTSASDVDQYDY